MLPEWTPEEEQTVDIEPHVKIRSRYVFFTFLYFIISSFLICLTNIFTCHFIFNLVHFFGTISVCVTLWYRLRKIAREQNKKSLVS